MKPVAEQVRLAQPPSLPRQNQEHRLKGILGILDMAEGTAADAEDEPSMPPHQFRERFLILPVREAGEEFTVARRRLLQLP
jgi:hypothetical protein